MATSKDQVKRKIAAAEKASQLVFGGMQHASRTLNANVSFNGFGVLRDPLAVRRQLEEAEGLIQQARLMLAAVDWPTDTDYDRF